MGTSRAAVLICLSLAGCLQIPVKGDAAGASGGPGGSGSSSSGTSGGQGSSTGGAPSSGTSGGYDPCLGVVCTASGAACYAGICKCGGPGGVECSAPGDACSPVDNSCGPIVSCAPPCFEPGTVCSPTDGRCHCGTEGGTVCGPLRCRLFFADGGGPLAPGEDAGGAAVIGECANRGPCSGVTCPAFETCDPSNFDPTTLIGRCECGGDPANNIPGVVCATGETCFVVFDGGPATCVQD